MSDTKKQALRFNQFSSAALAIEQRPPATLVRMVSLGICVMSLMVLGFASWAHMDIVVSTQGKVIPSGKSKVIQPLEAGVVRAILVKDGQAVKAGDVLLELDATNSGADRERTQRELWESEADALRLKAQMNGQTGFVALADMPAEIVSNQIAMLQGRLAEQSAKLAALDADIAKRRADTDAITNNIAQLSGSLPYIEQKHQMREDLVKTGHVAKTGVIESRLELMNAQKEISVQGNRLQESQASYNAALQQRAQALAEFRARSSTELMDATKKRDAAKQELLKATQRRELQTLRAPIDGVVQQLAVTTVGGVVTAAQALLTIVPEHTPLEIEAQVANRDIGHIKVGQRVINKVETYDFTRFGYIEGEVLWVGTDVIVDQRMGPIYPVRIKLAATQTPNVVNGFTGQVTAGMNITADIRTDSRRMIEYFVAPMLRYKEEALRER